MSALLDNGLEVTALHNHFFFENPRIFYMHVHGHGKAADLARMAKPAVDLIGHGSPHHQSSVSGGRSNIAAGQIDTAKIAKLVGHEGEQTGPVYKITIGRDDLNLKEMGATINARMGLNTWAAFFGSDANAEVAGDIAMLASEVTPVLKALRANDLEVIAIHNHMTGTQRRSISCITGVRGRPRNWRPGLRPPSLSWAGTPRRPARINCHESGGIKSSRLAARLAGVFSSAGTFGFGGPIALTANGPGPRVGARLDLAAELFRSVSLCPSLARAIGGPTRHVDRVVKKRGVWARCSFLSRSSAVRL
jgi:hypothetical protein